MYKRKIRAYSTIKGRPVKDGESIEVKVRRILTNKEPITDGAPLIYTEKSAGVMAGYNIRTDRWELATDAMDKIHKSNIAKTDSIPDKKETKVIDINEGKDDAEGKSIPGKADDKKSV